jgi:dihydrodipicolinate synthase/N-acetylneuraminate lyase
MTPTEKEIIDTLQNLYAVVTDLQHVQHGTVKTLGQLHQQLNKGEVPAPLLELEDELKTAEQTLGAVQSKLKKLGAAV